MFANSTKRLKPKLLLLTTLVLGLVTAAETTAEGYGIYEPRGMAMGGAMVGLANTDNALFYNPALLAFHDGDEDKTRDGSFFFPIISAQVSDTVNDVVDIQDGDFTDTLSAAVSTFNSYRSPTNAQAVADSSREVLDAIDPLIDEDVFADGFVGLSLTEPGDREGAGFYLGGRVLGGGNANVSNSDQALLDDYIEAMDFIASSGAQGQAHPELFNGGVLIDPVDSLNSSASVTGLAIAEAGVTWAQEYSLWGQPVAVGITPKWMRVRTYEATQSLQGGDIDKDTSEQDFYTANADLGLATEFAGHYRIGLAIKDVVTKHFDTDLGNTVELSAKPRLGLAYVTERVQVGVDFDLDRVAAIGDEAAIQELSLGGEWQTSRYIWLRGGYRHDLRGERDDIASLGLGFNLGGMLIDIAYALGGTSEGVALQLGFRH